MIEITMPRLSDTMEEGSIAAWHKKAGDQVEIGDVLVEIETDKATMEYEAYEAGTLAEILVDEGELVSIGTPIAKLDDGSGETGSDSGADSAEKPEKPEKTEKQDSTAEADAEADQAESESANGDEQDQARQEESGSAESAAASTSTTTEGGERRIASPLVRKIARENDLDLSSVQGTGPGGRIIRKDLDALLAGGGSKAASEGKPAASKPAAEAKPAAKAPASTPGANEKRGTEDVPMNNVRRVIARRLGESARSIPHFYVTATADAEELVKLRASLNEQLIAAGRPKVSINDLLIRACAIALTRHPEVNASYVGDDSTTMQIHHRVNVGVAVAGDNGLVVPVITDADQKTVTQLGAEAKTLVGLANDKKLTPEQMSGGTFTISNLGMFGVEEFTAIINPPEGAILAVGGTKKEAVVVGDEIVAHHVMRYTLSADHRIIDGALAAQFLKTLSGLIENPWTIIA